MIPFNKKKKNATLSPAIAINCYRGNEAYSRADARCKV